MTTVGGSQAREFVGTLRLGRLASYATNLAFAPLALAWWLTGGLPSRGPWIYAGFGVSILLYYFIISVRRAVVKLDGATLVAGRYTFSRAGLTVEPRRWVDDTNGYGTTEGTALVLAEGGHRLIIGCKGSAPAGDLPTTGDVRIVLPASALGELVAALRAGGAAVAQADAAGALTVRVAPSPSGARRRWLTTAPFFAAVAVIAWAGNSPENLHWMMAGPLHEVWIPAVLGLVMATTMLLANRSSAVRSLRVEGGLITYRDRRGKTLASCELRELEVERARHAVRGRFGSFDYPVLTLRWPSGSALVLGAAEWPGPTDPELPRRLFAPPFLIGAGEWDALSQRLRG